MAQLETLPVSPVVNTESYRIRAPFLEQMYSPPTRNNTDTISPPIIRIRRRPMIRRELNPVPLEPVNIVSALRDEFNEYYSDIGLETHIPPPPRLRRQTARYYNRNGLFKDEVCHMRLPDDFQDILGGIVDNLETTPLHVLRDRLVACDMIYRECYDNGNLLFGWSSYVPSFIECVLCCICDRYSMIKRCAFVHNVCRICMGEPSGTMILKLHGYDVWERMLKELPCPLLWEIYVRGGGDTRTDPHIVGDFSDTQQIFIYATCV